MPIEHAELYRVKRVNADRPDGDRKAGQRGGGERNPAGRTRKGGHTVIRDLSVLTPPLVVCVAFLIGVAAFLRHEMGARRRRRDEDATGDISANGTIADTEGKEAATAPHDEEAPGAD
jgi:hypothetical protein